MGEPSKSSMATSTSENRLPRKSNLGPPSTGFFALRCKLHHSKLRENIKHALGQWAVIGEDGMVRIFVTRDKGGPERNRKTRLLIWEVKGEKKRIHHVVCAHLSRFVFDSRRARTNNGVGA